MSVTNYVETSTSPFSGPSSKDKVKTGNGNGTPVGDTAFADDAFQPIGSKYVNLDDSSTYVKTATGDSWSKADAVSSIVGTTADTTTDFTSVAVGDLIVHIPVVAGNARFGISVTIGTSPFAAAVGDLYLIIKK